MKIPWQVLTDLLEPYKPNARYLISAEDLGKEMQGNFFIEHSIYAQPEISSGHLNMIDLMICYNQLAYVGIANKIKQGELFQEIISYEYVKLNQLKMLITSSSNIKFKAPIDSKYFRAWLKLSKIKRMHNVYFVRTEFDFENKITGEVTLAMQL